MKKTKGSQDNYILSYYQQIKNGKIIVGQFIERVYEYIIKGLEDKLFFYDQAKANKAVEWIEEHSFHSEGPLAPGNLKLELWQKAMISCIFGILDSSGKRQFREVVLIVARKNGKSLLASAIAKYIWWVDGGYGTRVYCLAPKLDQADIIYNDIWQHTVLDPEWKHTKERIENSKDIHNKKTLTDVPIAEHGQSDLHIKLTNSTVKKIAFSAKKSDGFNPSLTICDEIASWEGDKGLKQYSVMKSAAGAREEPLLLSCSTAGYVNDSIYDELIKRSTSFLLGNSKESKLLPFLYIIDDVEKWNDINELRKSNPNLGVSTSIDYLLEEIAIAEGSLPLKAEFMTKYCNIKQNSSQAWLDSVEVGACCGEALRFEDFTKCYAVCGLDLSRTTDLTAAICLIERDGILNVFAHFWMPAELIEQATARDNVPYADFVKQGWLSLSGDNFVDYHDAEQWFVDLINKYRIYPLKIGYDRYSAQYLIQDLRDIHSFQVDDVFQGTNLTPVIREMEGLIKDRKFNFGNNALLISHLLDSALKTDVELNKVKLVKVSGKVHIDGTAALLDALCVRQKWWSEIGGQLENKRT